MPCPFFGALSRGAVSVSLSCLLAFPGRGGAAPLQAPPPAKLNIVIVEGDGAINNVRQRTARETIVQVEDENHKPVAGAAVVFLLPGNGPGGVWANGTRTLQVTTNSQGRAVAQGLRPNNVSGKFQIQVEASFQGLTTTATVTQVNAVITGAAAGGGGLSTAKLIAILAAAGGAVAAGAVLATRGGSASPPAPTTTTISPGAPGVGAP